MVGGFVQESLADNDSSNPSICFPDFGGNNMYICILFISLRHIFHHLLFFSCGSMEGWGRSSRLSLLTQPLEIGALGGFSRKRQFKSHSLVILLFWFQYWEAVKTRIVVRFVVLSCPRSSMPTLALLVREAYAYQNGWNFGKVPKGGGDHFQSKNLCCKIWTFKRGFFGMKMTQKGFFRVCFFNNLKRKIRTGHIGKQDTFDPHPPLEMFQKSSALVMAGFPISQFLVKYFRKWLKSKNGITSIPLPPPPPRFEHLWCGFFIRFGRRMLP